LLSIVIPTHNRKEDVLALLMSLDKQTGVDFEVLVVDDASTDGTLELIRSEFPCIRVLRLEENVGPAVARNEGIKASSGEVVVGLDSDTELLEHNMLCRINELFKSDQDIQFAAFRLINAFSMKDDALRWWHPRAIEKYADQRFISDYFSGTGYAARKEVFDKAGLFPDDLFMHLEENELAIKVIRAGFNITYIPEIRVCHKASETSRNMKIEFYYKRRNQVWVACRYWPWWFLAVYIMPRLAVTLFRSILAGRVSMYASSIYDTIAGLPRVLKMREPLSMPVRRRLHAIRRGTL
jgi:GT2 family glycosyltransferase